jgi:conjugative transfer signal peptidase TraF
MNRKYLVVTVAAATLSAALFGVVTWQAPVPRLLWNASASAPIGLYAIERTAAPDIGDLVAVHPPAALGRFLNERRYLPFGIPLLKRVAALPGARVCRSGAFVTVDGHGMARARARDRQGRPLPVWHGCRIVGANELFLVNAAPDSLDGRYFGPMLTAGLIGVAHPLLTRGAPGAPLRWRPAARSHPFFDNEQE